MVYYLNNLEIPGKPMAIQQTITIKASPQEVYTALMSADEFSKVTGAPAEISDKDGGAFSCFGGQINGRQIELTKDKQIVQAWRAGPWPDGAYSIVRFDLSPAGDATELSLHHTGFPEDAAEHLAGGWQKMYWEPLQAHFEKD